MQLLLSTHKLVFSTNVFPNSTEPALNRRWEVSLEGRNGSGRLKVSGGPASLEGVFRPSYGG